MHPLHRGFVLLQLCSERFARPLPHHLCLSTLAAALCLHRSSDYIFCLIINSQPFRTAWCYPATLITGSRWSFTLSLDLGTCLLIAQYNKFSNIHDYLFRLRCSFIVLRGFQQLDWFNVSKLYWPLRCVREGSQHLPRSLMNCCMLPCRPDYILALCFTS